MIIKFDMDGVITNETTWNSNDEARCYQARTPNQKTIDFMRKLVQDHHVVIIETARRERWRTLTESWLEAHGVSYHYLFMNKIICDYVIDDLSRTVEEVFRIAYGASDVEDEKRD